MNKLSFSILFACLIFSGIVLFFLTGDVNKAGEIELGTKKIIFLEKEMPKKPITGFYYIPNVNKIREKHVGKTRI